MTDCAADRLGFTKRVTRVERHQRRAYSKDYLPRLSVCLRKSEVHGVCRPYPALLVFPDQGRCGFCSSRGCRRADRSALFLRALPVLQTGDEVPFGTECTTARGRRRDPPGFTAGVVASAELETGAAATGECAVAVVEEATLGGRTPSRSACLSPRAVTRSSALADAALSRAACSDLGVGSNGSVKVLPARNRSRKDSA
jgi:hypothetical protein